MYNQTRSGQKGKDQMKNFFFSVVGKIRHKMLDQKKAQQ